MGKFVIKNAKNGVMFNLVAGNGEVIAVSQTYSSKSSCKNGIDSVIKNAPSVIEDQTKEGFEEEKNPKWEIYKDKAGEFRFRLKASNGEIIATGEGYTSKAGCKNGIESIRKNVQDVNIVDETGNA